MTTQSAEHKKEYDRVFKQSPAYKAQHAARERERRKTPEAKAAERERGKKRRGTPAYQARQRAYHQRPAVKARRKELGARPGEQDKKNACRRDWVERNPGKESEYHRKYNYGLLPGEWDAMFTAQGAKCGICGADDPASKKGWQTDHCHIAGKVRWILCADCNRMLGPKVTPALLRHAADLLDALIPS